jgi:hypothetical protein
LRTSFLLILPAAGIGFGLVLAILNSADEGKFLFERQAAAHCPSDTVVWVNTLSHVYHFPGVSSHGNSFYWNTREGTYMCESDARAAGNRAAKDERHP